MSAVERAAQVRGAAGLFRLAQRGVGEVSGGDRIRWLDGMVSNDVASLAAGPERSGCYAALLTPQGRIVSDLQVLLRPESLWIETERAALPGVLARLEKYVIADDVALRDASDELARLGIEGPRAPAIVADALGRAPELAADAGVDAQLGRVPVVVAAFGWSGEPAFQIYAPVAAEGAVVERLREAGRNEGLVEADADVLEILRIEAGAPRLGAELDEEVLPAEARLERAISTTKGCYTGQEVVARLRSRGQVKHMLVGLRFEAGEPPKAGAEVTELGGKARQLGEVTSACESPQAGAIALAFVRRPFDEPGTEVAVGPARARVAALPFVAPLVAQR